MRILRRLLLLCPALFLAACTEADYDLGKINSDITLFGGGIAVPLGSTTRLGLTDIAGSDAAELLATDSDGAYSLRFEKDSLVKGKFEDFQDIMAFKASRYDIMPVTYDLGSIAGSVITVDKIDVDITTEPMTIPAGTKVNGIEMPSSAIEDFSFKVAEGYDNFGKIKVYPEGNPKMRVHFIKSSNNVSISPDSDGVILYIPKCIVLKDIPAGCIYNTGNNTVTIPSSSGELSDITLSVDYISASPVQKENNQYFLEGTFSTGGHICAAASANVSGFTLGMEVECDSFKADRILFSSFTADFTAEDDIVLIKASDISDKLSSASEVELENAFLNLYLTVSNLPQFEGKTPQISVDIDIPEWIESDTRTIHLEGYPDAGGRLDCSPIPIRRLNLSGVDLSKDITAHYKLHVTAALENPVLLASSLESDLVTCTGTCELSEFKVKKISGKFTYETDPMRFSVDLSELRRDLNDGYDITLDLVNPALELLVSTNFSIPVNAEFTVLPYLNGKPTDGFSVKAELPYTSSSGMTRLKGFYLCNSDKDMPEGYTFAKCDLGRLLKDIPDSLAVTFTAASDTKEDAPIESLTEYQADVRCCFNAPLRFGEDFSFCLRDTIDASAIAPYISGTCIAIGGEVASTLPVQAAMQLDFLDSDGSVIALKEPAVQTIAAGGADGSATVTKLNLNFTPQDNSAAAGIQKAVITFRVSSADIQRAVKESDYLQAKLYLALPEGYNTDIKL